MRGDAVSVGLKWHTYGHPAETDFDDFLAVARAADSLGYDGLFPVDHMHMPKPQILGFSAVADADRPYFPEPWTSLAAAAAATQRIALGPQVTPLSLRHPVFVAWMGATLDRISHGRLILQVGAGWNRSEYESFGFQWPETFAERRAALVEGLAVVERLWTEAAAVDQDGLYPLRGAELWPKPLQRPRPPIWFGGTSRAMRRLTGRQGDGWCPALYTVPGGPSGFGPLFEEVRAAAKAGGRDPDAIVPAGLVWVVVERTRERAHELAEVLRRRDDWSGLTPNELSEAHLAVIGTPDDCRLGLQAWIDAGVRHLTVGLLPISGRDATLEAVRLFAEEVRPRLELKAAGVA